MPIPTYEQMLRPILAMAAAGTISRKTVVEPIADHFSVSREERESRIPSGQATYVRNRAGWAMTFLTKGGLIEKVAPRTYAITDRGREFLRQHPKEFTARDLQKLPGWVDAWSTGDTQADAPGAPEAQSSTPQERLDEAVATINAELKSRLLTAILEQTPAFFEQLVLDVLVKMGYGGSRSDAAEHLGRSNDEGVDGRINQDTLGLDQIVVQAKRYAPNRPIDRATVQAFVGSMTGQGVTKGIFITTSSFNANAREFVQRGSHTKVVLIDGDALLNFMLEHEVGVRAKSTIKVLELDQNYFDEE